MSKKIKIKYEDMSDIINVEIRKRKNKWFLDSVPWVDFSDVEQIIRVHIYQKWDQWDQSRDLKPWINKIITNQFKNILRNYYLNFAKPCTSCPFDGSELSEKYYEVYLMLFIDNKSEDEVAKKLGYRTNEQGRAAGYKQIKNIKKMIKEKVVKIIKEKDILN